MSKQYEIERIAKEYGTSDNDTGSIEVQVAVLTEKINSITDHLKQHKKDHSTRRGLLKMVGRRNRFLGYLKGKDFDRYVSLIGRLGLRK